ncbi:parallel beta-helix repeat protein [Labedella gwakjiensis]|uniref:Parallel beta-helix repeat protein n=1 Tax=Labedella gwakjiensis TaxID=390269 RepID=A0A2P8GSE9_9MICO|nr:parallel beta-helix repeat protein [Labedella gwakjiensis]
MTLRRTSFIDPNIPSTTTRSDARRLRRTKARTYRAALAITAMAAVGALAVTDLAATTSDASAATWVTGDRIAADDFSRTVSKGLGTADAGGAYTSATTSGLSVKDGAAAFALPQGAARNALLTSVSTPDVESRVTVVVPSLPSGGNGVYVALQARSDGKSFYRTTLRITPSGSAGLSLSRANGSTASQVGLASEKIVATGLKAGSRITLALRVHGTTSVEVASRAWVDGSSTPAWQRTATDTSSKRIASGGIGLWTYLSGLSKPYTVRLDGLSASRLVPQTAPAPTTQPTSTPTTSASPTPSPTSTPTTTPTPTTAPTTPAPTPTTPAPTPTSPSTGDRGAAPIGTTNYSVPSGAIFVSSSATSSGNGSKSSPYSSVERAIAAAPSGATIVIRGGSYHETVEIPSSKRLTVQSYPGEAVWFDGSEQVSKWSKSSTGWTSTGYDVDLDSGIQSEGAPDNDATAIRFLDPAYPLAAHPDQVWIGGTELTQVGSESAVKAGTFFVDKGRDRLVIGSDPSGKTVTSSTLQKAMKITGDGSVVRGIGFTKYGTSVWQNGAVTAQADNVLLENVVITDNATNGISSWGTGVTYNKVTLTKNGMLGGGTNAADNFSMTNSYVGQNNTERFNRMPVSGGFKVTRSRNVTFTNNDFIGNMTAGLWLDESVYNGVVTGNRSLDNGSTGIILEISDTMKVANNLISGNGRYGLWIGNTGNVQVWNNTITDNAMAPLQFSMDKRRQTNLSQAGHDRRQKLPDMTVPWIISNVTVSNNIISANGGGCIVCVDDNTKQMTAEAMGISLNGNLYERESEYSPTTLVRWGQGKAKAKTFSDLAEFTAATGHDKASALSEGRDLFNANLSLTSAGKSAVATVVPRGLPSSIAALIGQLLGKTPSAVGSTLTR